MSNPWLRALEEVEELNPDSLALSNEVYAILALVKELQTLNETLKQLKGAVIDISNTPPYD